MANQNFVVHNGLTVGPTTIDAASGNVALPVGKQITVGNVILRDEGDGKLHIRDITDNSDAELVGTVGAVSTTSGNIQIGTNHIESTNPNGPISVRPNGGGNIALAANTIMIGKGGEYTLVSTGEVTDPAYEINYTPSNIIVQTTGALGSGNVRINMTTDSTDFNTGALQVMGGMSVRANVHIGENLHIAGNLEVNGTQTIFNTNNASFNDGLIYLADGNAGDVIDLGFLVAFDNGTYQHGGLIRDASNSEWYLFEGVIDEATTTVNMAQASYSNLTLNILTGTATNAQYADLAEMYSADAEIEPGTVVHFGGTAEVSTCDTDHCTRVAGVVSTNPAHLMNTELVAEHKIELALTGRVPCKVTGAVAKGDMMVSAGNGRARAEANPRVGAVIGKALENWEGGEGVIEVVVGKH